MIQQVTNQNNVYPNTLPNITPSFIFNEPIYNQPKNCFDASSPGLYENMRIADFCIDSRTQNDLLTVITMKDCPWCIKAVNHLNERGINFLKIDMNDDRAKEYINIAYSDTGKQSYPMVFKGKQYLGGYGKVKEMFP
jgi:glutaredoxin